MGLLCCRSTTQPRCGVEFSASQRFLPLRRQPAMVRLDKQLEQGVKRVPLRYLHTMVRVANIEKSLDFYCKKLGMQEIRRIESEAGRYTNIFLTAPEDKSRATTERAPLLELTFNWDPEVYGEGRNFGHLAFEVDDIYDTCNSLMKSGITINRPPRDGRMAFVRSPDNISIELLQKGESKPKQEPWASMPNTGKW
jgi:lactoylglutathione lyase